MPSLVYFYYNYVIYKYILLYVKSLRPLRKGKAQESFVEGKVRHEPCKGGRRRFSWSREERAAYADRSREAEKKGRVLPWGRGRAGG